MHTGAGLPGKRAATAAAGTTAAGAADPDGGRRRHSSLARRLVPLLLVAAAALLLARHFHLFLWTSSAMRFHANTHRLAANESTAIRTRIANNMLHNSLAHQLRRGGPRVSTQPVEPLGTPAPTVPSAHNHTTRGKHHGRRRGFERSWGWGNGTQSAVSHAAQLATCSSANGTTEEMLRHHHLFRPDQLGRAELEPCAAHTAPGEEEFLPGSWMGSSTEGGWTLPLTHEAQRAIWEHQNPKNCSAVKFLAVQSRRSGIGSIFHVMSVMFAVAMENGRVLVEVFEPPLDYDSGGFLAAEVPQCNGTGTIERCYLIPWSHCPPPTLDELRKAAKVRRLTDFLAAGDARVVRMDVVDPDARTLVPARFRSKLATTSLQPEKHYYWWRAQTTAYMVRPNERIVKEMQDRTRRTLVGALPQPGCIALHIRHGDKAVEAPVYSDATYDCTARKLRELRPELSRQLFLSTEDPASVKYFANRSDTWNLTYTEVPRKPDKLRSNAAYMTEIGWWEEMVNSLMNLDLALRCSAWVGAINSNWVRLINELRSTVGCKAHMPFLDAEVPDPHAMDVNW